MNSLKDLDYYIHVLQTANQHLLAQDSLKLDILAFQFKNRSLKPKQFALLKQNYLQTLINQSQIKRNQRKQKTSKRTKQALQQYEPVDSTPKAYVYRSRQPIFPGITNFQLRSIKFIENRLHLSDYQINLRELSSVQYINSLYILLGVQKMFYHLNFQVVEEVDSFDEKLYFQYKRAKFSGRMFSRQFPDSQPRPQAKDRFLADKYINDFLKKSNPLPNHSTISQILQSSPSENQESVQPQINLFLAQSKAISQRNSKEEDPKVQQQYQELKLAESSQEILQKTQQKKSYDAFQLIQNFKKGFHLLKYAKGSVKSKVKLVFLSQDQKLICWKNPLKKQKQKSIKLNEIIAVRQSRDSEGFKKFDTLQSKQRLWRLSICIKTKKRIVELQAENNDVFESLLRGMQLIFRKYNLTIETPVLQQ